ncbi:efflux RND transporter permease subunit [Candidatus Reidiella endopervernicosa]|uniref:Efflux RND transporter permease subunit n=1 Tax=Candidatus Reidiella endopervernicosa TaxID=2738883 RepID=A0A6N0I0V9_9GAMM|nr:efflux RND transporter permease subunit [Candidatus Reidiella endopervernicosa]
MIRFSINNPLITNLMLALVLIAGVLAWYAMPQEMFPSIELDKASIRTVFEGASPEEVERQISIPIEEEFDAMADIDVITSSSNEGISTITIELKSGSDVDEFMREAQSALDQVTDLPEEAEEPELTRLKARFPVISATLYGDIDAGHLNELAEQVQRRLQQLPGVASAGMAGDRSWELWVVVDPQRLAARGVALAQVTRALRENLRDLPGGSLKAREGDILLRGKGVAPEPEAIRRVVISSNAQGGQLRLGELAEVEMRLEEARTLGRFNGKPSINLTVTKSAEASTIIVAERVRELVEELRMELPPGVEIGLFSDLSVYVKNRLDTVKSSGLIGLALVLLSLYLVLNFRVALITAMGIPVSFLVAVILLQQFGYTINMISLFAFLIALGMIVDDAIIVTENIYRHMEAGMAPRKAAELGAKEVFWPVLASITTTVAAFLPMFAITGTMGAFIAVIPVVVTAALFGSLWEAFGVLPSHANEILRVQHAKKKRIDWSHWLHRYTELVRWSANNRYLVTTATVGILVVVMVFAATRLPFKLFGHVDVGQFFINVETPNTYSLDESSLLAKKMEQALFDELDDDELNTLLTNVGVSFIDFNRIRFGSQYIQLIVDLDKQAPKGFIERYVTPIVSLKFSWEGTRERETEVVIDALRERMQTIAGIKRLSILRTQGGPAGADIEIGVTGPDVDQLRRHAETVTDYLRRLPGTRDVQQDLEVGKLEYRYALNERGRELGLTQQQLSESVRTGFLGLEALHVTRGDKRIPVRVIYPDELRHSGTLERLPVTLSSGRTVYLGEVADIEPGRSLNTINRRDMRRLATITAEVNDAVSTPLEVTELFNREFKHFAEQYPGYELLFMGEKREAGESIASMLRALVISLAIIFFILAALFRSLLDPLVVMFAIPFGAIGVIFGHALLGHTLQFLSMVGFLALSGIVVNDSLILVDFAKRLRREGWERIDAVVEAGRVRVRPIMLTSITTFLGVSPLIFFATGQTAFLSPMAVSLGIGLLFATVLILIVIPCFFIIADDLRQWAVPRMRHLFGLRDRAVDEAMPMCVLPDEEELQMKHDELR